jgi:uncharacterized protein YigE (DUF2233 family)
VLTRVALFPHILLFVVLPLHSSMEGNRKCKSDKKARKSYKIMTVDEKVNTVDMMRGGMSEAAGA